MSEMQRPLQQVVQGIAFSYLCCVPADKDQGTALRSHTDCAVGTVVGYHKDPDQLRRVVLHTDACQQMGQYRFLVAGGDQNGIAVKRFGRRKVFLTKQGKKQI